MARAAVREGRRSWEVKVIEGGDGSGPSERAGGTVVGLSPGPQRTSRVLRIKCQQ